MVVLAATLLQSRACELCAQQIADDRPQLRVARLIRQLGSPSYEARESAERALAEFGAQNRVHLERASHSDDPEVRLRGEAKCNSRLKTSLLLTRLPSCLVNPAMAFWPAISMENIRRRLFG